MKVWKNPYIRRFNEVPLTIVKDLNASLKVEMIQKPEITGALREFVECGSMSHAPDFNDAGTSLKQLIKENALWQGLETLHFTFKVTNCSRMLTHQLVRQRVGITFSQQCSDSVDWRHHNIVLPRAISVTEDKICMLIGAKMMYAKEIDSMKVSCQEARYLLPQCLETFIYIHVSLATLIFMLKKRMCTMAQPWETYRWAFLTREALLMKFPELGEALKTDCFQKKCFYHKAKENPTSAYLYIPDAEHAADSFEWSPESYIYNNTHEEMSNPGFPHEDTYFQELIQITEAQYLVKASEYNLCL